MKKDDVASQAVPVLVAVVVVGEAPRAADGRIVSKGASSSYGEGWERIFGSKKDQPLAN